MDKLDQRIQLVASAEFSKIIDQWRRTQSDLPSKSEAIRRLVQIGLAFEEEHPMRMVTAIIRPNKYDKVRDALLEKGVEGVTITEVKGFGRQRGKTEVYRGAEYETFEVPKIRLDIVVPSTILDEVLETIIKTAETGKIGDGKLFVHGLTDAIRIRTGETGEKALQNLVDCRMYLEKLAFLDRKRAFLSVCTANKQAIS